MSERRPSRKRSGLPSALLCTELAVLGAILLHVAFFYLLKIQPVSGHDLPPAAEEAECVFVAPYQEATAWEKELRAWCFLADPSIFSVPDEERGFSLVRETERSLPLTEPPLFQLPVKAVEERVFPALVLAPPPAPLADEVSKKWSLPRPAVAAVPATSRLPPGILWHFPDGRLITDLPAFDVAVARKAAAEGGAPTAPTHLEVNLAGSLPRVVLRRSSGNRVLDELAVRELCRNVLKHEVSVLPPAQAPAWLPAAGQRVALDVEWRLLPAEPAPPAADSKGKAP